MLIVTYAIGSVAAIAAIEWAPHDQNSNVAVVFPPWIRGADAAARAADAGADLVRNGRFPFVMIVRPQRSDFTGAVYREGALIVLDASALGGCFRARPAS